MIMFSKEGGEMTNREKILFDLEPLFEKAENEGLWFHCVYQDLWFSPEELRKEHEKGKFIWGAVNWQLRDPKEKLNELEAKKRGIEREIERFCNRMKS